MRKKKRNTGGASRRKRASRTRKPTRVRLTGEDLAGLEDSTDWDRVGALTDADIERAIAEDPDAAPVLDATFWRNAQILDPRHEKSAVTMRVDNDVLEFFKQRGPGYQSRMNAVLRAYVYARLHG